MKHWANITHYWCERAKKCGQCPHCVFYIPLIIKEALGDLEQRIATARSTLTSFKAEHWSGMEIMNRHTD